MPACLIEARLDLSTKVAENSETSTMVPSPQRPPVLLQLTSRFQIRPLFLLRHAYPRGPRRRRPRLETGLKSAPRQEITGSGPVGRRSIFDSGNLFEPREYATFRLALLLCNYVRAPPVTAGRAIGVTLQRPQKGPFSARLIVAMSCGCKLRRHEGRL